MILKREFLFSARPMNTGSTHPAQEQSLSWLQLWLSKTQVSSHQYVSSGLINYGSEGSEKESHDKQILLSVSSVFLAVNIFTVRLK